MHPYYLDNNESYYLDCHLSYRLGVNHWQIPVNQAKGVGVENLCPFSRDGQMRILDDNQGSKTHY